MYFHPILTHSSRPQTGLGPNFLSISSFTSFDAPSWLSLSDIWRCPRDPKVPLDVIFYQNISICGSMVSYQTGFTPPHKNSVSQIEKFPEYLQRRNTSKTIKYSEKYVKETILVDEKKGAQKQPGDFGWVINMQKTDNSIRSGNFSMAVTTASLTSERISSGMAPAAHCVSSVEGLK